MPGQTIKEPMNTLTNYIQPVDEPRSLVRKDGKLRLVPDCRQLSLPLAPGEVLIKMQIGAICRTDIFVAKGLRGSADSLVIGHEAAGEVYATGKGVSLPVGERVAINPIKGCLKCEYCRVNRYHLCADQKFIGLTDDGCFASFFRISERNLLSLPDSVSWQEAAYLEPVAAALAVLTYQYLPGEKVGITGSNRIAFLVKAILALCEVEAEIIHLDTLYRSEFPESLFDVIIETFPGTDMLNHCIRLLKPGGHLLLKSRPVQAVSFDMNAALQKEVRLHACAYGSFEESLKLLDQKQLDVRPFCGTLFPLDDYEEALLLADSDESLKYFFALDDNVWHSSFLL